MLLHVKFNIHYLKKIGSSFLIQLIKITLITTLFLNKMFNVVNAFYNIPIIES